MRVTRSGSVAGAVGRSTPLGMPSEDSVSKPTVGAVSTSKVSLLELAVPSQYTIENSTPPVERAHAIPSGVLAPCRAASALAGSTASTAGERLPLLQRSFSAVVAGKGPQTRSQTRQTGSLVNGVAPLKPVSLPGAAASRPPTPQSSRPLAEAQLQAVQQPRSIPQLAPAKANTRALLPLPSSGNTYEAIAYGVALPLGVTLPCGASSTRRCPQPPWTVAGPGYKGEKICTVLSVEKVGSGHRALCHHAGDTTNALGEGPMPDRGAYSHPAMEVMAAAPEHQIRVDSLIARLDAEDEQLKQKSAPIRKSATQASSIGNGPDGRPNSPEWMGLVDGHGNPNPTYNSGDPITLFAPASPPRRAPSSGSSGTRKNMNGRLSATQMATSPLRSRPGPASSTAARRQVTFDPAVNKVHHMATTDITQPAGQPPSSEDWRQNRPAVLANLDATTLPAFTSAMSVVFEAYAPHAVTSSWTQCQTVASILLDYPALAMRTGTSRERQIYFQQAEQASKGMLQKIEEQQPSASPIWANRPRLGQSQLHLLLTIHHLHLLRQSRKQAQQTDRLPSVVGCNGGCSEICDQDPGTTRGAPASTRQ